MVIWRIQWLALLVALAAILLIAAPLNAQVPAQVPAQTQSSGVQLWNIAFADQADLNRLAAELDLWEVDHTSRQVLAPLTADQVATLRLTHKLTLAPDQTPLNAPRVAQAFTPSQSQNAGIPGFACYRTVDETYATFDQLEVDYPQLVQQVDIGDSWDKGDPSPPAGDDLRVIVITNQQTTGPKFRFLLMGAIHARELTTGEAPLRFAESLLQGYGHDATATWLLDHGELHLLPLANPDGRRMAESGLLWRKNTHMDATCTVNPSTSTYGVDLNRNSSFEWNSCPGCSSGYSCSLTYRGESPASEPEVAAIEAYMKEIFPDQREADLAATAPGTTSGLFISLHSYGRLVLFPWGSTADPAPNGPELATLARRFGYHLGYTVCQAGAYGCLYQTDGTTDDFAYGELGVAGFTFELGTNFFQSCTDFEESILPPTLDALRYAFTAAPLPYQLPSGPEVLNLVVSAHDQLTQTHVIINATADANRLSTLSGFDSDALTKPTEPITAARVTIDHLPWTPSPVSTPLSASDGQFDSFQEEITTTVEIASVSCGRHTIFAQAQDSAGDWGVVAAEFFTVTNNTPLLATIQNAQADPATETTADRPITYTVALTNTGATTETFALEVTGDAYALLTPSSPITLTAGETTQFALVLTKQSNTVDTDAPTVLIIRSVVDQDQCYFKPLDIPTDAPGEPSILTRLPIIRQP